MSDRFFFASEAEKAATIELLKVLRRDKRHMEGSRKAGVDTVHTNLPAFFQRAITPMRKVVADYRGDFLRAVERRVYQAATTGSHIGLTYTQLIEDAESAQVA